MQLASVSQPKALCALSAFLLTVLVVSSSPLHSSAYVLDFSFDDNVQPKVFIVPENNIRWAVGEKFQTDVHIANVSGMCGVYFELYWNGFYDPRAGSVSPLLDVSIDDVQVWEDILPMPYKAYGLTVSVAAERSWLKFLCILDCGTLPQNGTARLLSISFMVLDPWESGRQPTYVETSGGWVPSNATADIVMWWGYCILKHPSLHFAYFGNFYGTTKDMPGYLLCGGSKFVFMPVPGDLDGNGVVNSKDVEIISLFYCADVTVYPNCYYDFNADGMIDICDIVIVSSNFGRVNPF